MLVWLDGIDNAGAGQHSTTTTTWTDLSGNNNSPTLTLGGTLTWNNNNFYFNDTKPTDFVFPTTLGSYQMGSWTVETRIIRENNATTDLIIAEVNWVYGYEIFCIRFYPNDNRINVYDGKYGYSDTKHYSTFEVTPGVATTITVTYTSGALKFYKDGVLANTINTTLTYTDGNHQISQGLGNYGSSKSDSGSTFIGNMYSIRIYNRVLTDSEVANNYAIDQARFQ